jgi:hypothetical protein
MDAYFPLGALNGRADVLSALGKSAGIFCVTLPEAAHPMPRRKVVMKPTFWSGEGKFRRNPHVQMEA